MGKYNDMPLAISRYAKSSFAQIRDFANKNSDNIVITKDSDFTLNMEGLGGNSKYFFYVGPPQQVKNRYIFPVEYAPLNLSSLDKNTVQWELSTILRNLSSWYKTIVEMDNITVHPEDEFEQFYKKEFDEWFEIVEDDAETMPFDSKRQLLIVEVINKSVPLLLEEGLEEEDPLIQKANWLKQNISRLTKKQVVYQLREVFAPLRKLGWDITKKVYEVAKGETIAMGYRLVVSNLSEVAVKFLEG